MDKFYYIISQLPILYFDKSSFMNVELFLMEAKKWLSRRDYDLLTQIRFDETSTEQKMPRLLKNYQKFEYQLRSDLALWRESTKKGQEIKPVHFPVTMLKEGNPLDVEKRLLAFRWQFLEELVREHHFDFAFLIIYLLKLQILERLSLFNKEKGLENFKNIVTIQTPDEWIVREDDSTQMAKS